MNESPSRCRSAAAASRPWLVLLLVGMATLHSPDVSAQKQGTAPPARATPRATATGTDTDTAPQAGNLSFKVDVVSENRRIARHLERYLDIQRFTDFPDLQPGELRRLLGAVESNARDLLAAQGYFSPRLQLQSADPGADPDQKRRIVIEVDPGEVTRIESSDIRFTDSMDSDAEGQRQREVIKRDWLLKDGDLFSQEGWDAAKTAGLRVLQRERYPTAHIVDSAATIATATNRAGLAITYDAGPAYRFGSLQLQGVDRYDAEGVRNIARLPTGAVYREETLLDAQQRLVTSGYFDSVFLQLDNSERNPDEATVIAELREARMQKIVFGVGYSTDTGARVSADHTHNEMPPLGWRALNHATAGLTTQALSTNWTDMPVASGWAWNAGLGLERSDVGDVKTNSLSLTGGRARLGDKSEHRYYLQYDASNAEGGNAPSSSASLLGNYSWTGRYFDNRLNPTVGHGIGLDGGAGLTLKPAGKPFLRFNARALKLWPFGGRNAAGKRSRLALRVEAGTIVAVPDVEIPPKLLFLTGGDTTVRGYSYQSIGARLDGGDIYGARNMAMASVEWQNPVMLFSDARSFEHIVFVDAGAAADRMREAEVFPGMGMGMRWASPMGPLELDVAYGTKTDKWRLHLRVGFQFQ